MVFIYWVFIQYLEYVQSGLFFGTFQFLYIFIICVQKCQVILFCYIVVFFNNLVALFQRIVGKFEFRVQLIVFFILDVSLVRCCLYGWGFIVGDSGLDGLYVLGFYLWKEDQLDWIFIFCVFLCDFNGIGFRFGYSLFSSQLVGFGFFVQKVCGVIVGF